MYIVHRRVGIIAVRAALEAGLRELVLGVDIAR